MSWHMPEWILAAQSWAHALAKLYYTRTLKYDMHPSDAHHMSKRPWMLFWGTGCGSLGTATAMGPVPYCAMYSGVVLGGGWAVVLGLAQVGWLKPFPSAQLAVRSATRVVEPTVRMVVSTIPVRVAASSSL